MAGLATRSRPILGEGSYLLPREFKLFPKVTGHTKGITTIKLEKELKLYPKVTKVTLPLVVPVIKGAFNLYPKVTKIDDATFGKFKQPNPLSFNKHLKGASEHAPADTNYTVSSSATSVYGSSVKAVIEDPGHSWMQVSGSVIRMYFTFEKSVRLSGFEIKWNKTSPNTRKNPRLMEIYAVDDNNISTKTATINLAERYVNITLESIMPQTVSSKRFTVVCSRSSGGYAGIQYLKFF